MSRPYLNPILIQNGGIEIINTTPRGKNHCWELLEVVRDNPKYFVQHLSILDTKDNEGKPIITAEQIEDVRRMGMSEELIQQEFFCSFNIGNVGAYFTREMNDMDNEGRILSLKPNPRLPLHTVFDLGGVDSTAVWIFQCEGNYIHLLAILQSSGEGLKFYLDWADKLRMQWGCQWGNHFGPHDIKQKHQSWEQAESRLMLARKEGWFFQVTPKLSIEDGIEAMRFIFPKLKVDKDACQLGIRAMREYEREYDEEGRCFKTKPLHNWSSHIMDALRYLAVNYRRLYNTPQETIKYDTSL